MMANLLGENAGNLHAAGFIFQKKKEKRMKERKEKEPLQKRWADQIETRFLFLCWEKVEEKFYSFSYK